jgi:predicted ribosome quality control (RQC) complex YloA/Tae2 family protein
LFTTHKLLHILIELILLLLLLLLLAKTEYENEDLIRYGLPEDVWFHVDDLSSAHVYLRMKPDMTLDDISDDLLLDCASMVKANSIAGCKVSHFLLQS